MIIYIFLKELILIRHSSNDFEKLEVNFLLPINLNIPQVTNKQKQISVR